LNATRYEVLPARMANEGMKNTQTPRTQGEHLPGSSGSLW
jgi:hypothetical protein